MADLDESGWKHVGQEPPNEISRLEGLGVPVLRLEDDGLVSDRDDALVRDGDAVRVLSEVVEDVARGAEGRLRVDVPLLLEQLVDELNEVLVGCESILRAFGCVATSYLGEEDSTKYKRQSLLGKEVALAMLRFKPRLSILG